MVCHFKLFVLDVLMDACSLFCIGVWFAIAYVVSLLGWYVVAISVVDVAALLVACWLVCLRLWGLVFGLGVLRVCYVDLYLWVWVVCAFWWWCGWFIGCGCLLCVDYGLL